MEETAITYVHPYLHIYLLNYLLTYLLTYLHTYLLTCIHAYIHTTKFKYILTGTNRTYNHIIHFWRTANTRETEWRLLHSLNFRLISNSDQVENSRPSRAQPSQLQRKQPKRSRKHPKKTASSKENSFSKIFFV